MIVYGAGSFSFETGHCAQKHPDWLGVMVEASIEDREITDLHRQFVRHNAANETVLRAACDEHEALTTLSEQSAALNASLCVDGERVRVSPC